MTRGTRDGDGAAKGTLSIELDQETIRRLERLGDPATTLRRLAESVAEAGQLPVQKARSVTDQRLQVERDKSDSQSAERRESAEHEADAVVQVARQRADEVVRTAEQLPGAAVANHSRLERERAQADQSLARERAQSRRLPDPQLAGDRSATDRALTGERTHSDTLLVDQREANTAMVSATLREQDLAFEAAEAKGQSEEKERELREAAELRELFMAILGHDLRNPLGAITIAAGNLLQRGRLDPQDQRTVGRIVSSSQRMTRLITQLLDLTRARLGGGFPIDPKPTDLAEVLGTVAEEFDTPPRVEVAGDVTGSWDPDRLEELVSNLVGNAIQYSTPGTTVVLRARSEGAEVMVEVINQGPAIPAELLPFIFEPFRRAKLRESSKTGNLGLGLYIAQQIVVSHGGSITARSEEGTTRFTVRLPRHVVAPPGVPGEKA